MPDRNDPDPRSSAVPIKADKGATKAVLESVTLALVLDLPLYSRLSVRGNANDLARQLRSDPAIWDRYCPSCGKESTFTAQDHRTEDQVRNAKRLTAAITATQFNPNAGQDSSAWLGNFQITIACARSHRAVMQLNGSASQIKNEDATTEPGLRLIKWGQWPSTLEFQEGMGKDLGAAIPKQLKIEYKRALNLASMDYAAAACLHLRRVFEGLVKEASDAELAARDGVWLEFAKASDTATKVQLLKSHLPPLMSEKPQLWTLLSNAVHEPTDEECEVQVPLLLEAIELVLEQKADAHRRAETERRVGAMLTQASVAQSTAVRP